MSAVVPMPNREAGDGSETLPEEKKAKRGWGFGRKNKEPKAPKGSKRAKAAKPPKVRKPRRPMGIASLLVLSALLTGGASLAIYYYLPDPEPTKVEDPAPAPSTPAPSPALLAREAAVARTEGDLEAREAALRERELEADRLMRDLGVTESANAALLRTAKLYVAMAPYKAAPLMAELDDTTAVQMLKLMTVDEAAAILSAMDSPRSARLMRELAAPPATNGAGQ